MRRAFRQYAEEFREWHSRKLNGITMRQDVEGVWRVEIRPREIVQAISNELLKGTETHSVTGNIRYIFPEAGLVVFNSPRDFTGACKDVSEIIGLQNPFDVGQELGVFKEWQELRASCLSSWIGDVDMPTRSEFMLYPASNVFLLEDYRRSHMKNADRRLLLASLRQEG
jgi:hypothetical protein